MQILPHTIVRVRRRRWRIVEARAFDDCTLVTLRGVEPPDFGVERHVLSPFDFVSPVARRTDSRSVGRRLWRRACRAALAADTPPGALRAAAACRIDLLPYQLEPALALVRGAACRLLLADEVGLGKTIQAGLIVSELRARAAAARVLVLTPAGVRDQWEAELRDRFGLAPVVADARTIRDAAAALPFDVNPWSTLGVAIASLDFVKRPEVLPAVSARPWDVVIVDEAHGAASDSERHAAAHVLCAAASYVLLLTATPHNGDDGAFASLCGIGQAAGDAPLVFRRTRRDAAVGGRRRVHTLFVAPDVRERRMHACLRAYTDAVLAERPDAVLALSVLHKRALSSAQALADSVGRRLAALGDQPDPSGAEQLSLPLDAAGDESDGDAPPAWPAELALSDRARERRLLETLASAAGVAACAESKIAALARWLRRINEPALVFTEYRDTLRHLEAALTRAPHGRRILVLHGGMTRDERRQSIAAFVSAPAAVMLATDAAGEGLNLQAACRAVVNLELPWNPMRLEQRIGRVDRIGQQRVVHAWHLVARGTAETALLARLRLRVDAARAAVGAGDPIGAHRDPVGSPTARTADLAADARAEAQRLSLARRLVNDSDAPAAAALDRGGTWTMRARPALKRRLRGRRLEIWRAAAEDACGRIAESRLVILLVDAESAAAPAAVAAAVERWRAEASRNTTAFATARLARDAAIAAQHPGPPRTRQPGLFYRRLERAQHARQRDEAAWREHVARRIESARQAGSLTFTPPERLLAAVP